MNNDIIDDINFIKNELESLNLKIDSILDMLNNFTIMLMEETDPEYDDDEDGWTPEQTESWNSYDEDDEEDDIDG